MADVPDAPSDSADGKTARRAAPAISLRRAFGRSFLAFAGVAVALGIACWWLKGPAAFERAIDDGVEMMIYIVPRIVGAMLVAAFIQVLVPREIVGRLIGEKSGFRGLIIATLAGTFTPGGPLTSFPIVVALHAAGANPGALIAYLSAWAMIGFQRMLIWEFPFMGPHFTALHLASSIALPVIAGMIANRLPIRIDLPSIGGR
jgi:uncharacterized membrane protein YraQ (UPF0718 family)